MFGWGRPKRPQVVAFDVIGTMFPLDPMRPSLMALGLPSAGLEGWYATAVRDALTRGSVRQWSLKCGTDFAHRLRRRRPKPGDTWHPDEVFLRMNARLHYLWCAVDQNGVVLDILVQDRRNAVPARRFFKHLLAGFRFKPRRIVTDGLRSYGVAHRELMPEARHRTSRSLNNRAENSHRPTRRRERQRQCFKSPEQAQRLLSAHAMSYGLFRPRQHLTIAAQHRRIRAKAFRIWRHETCVQAAA